MLRSGCVVLGVLAWTTSPASAQQATSPAAGAPIEAARLLQGPWGQGEVHGESVLFIKGKEGAPKARLLYDIDRVTVVRSADGLKAFEAGRDFRPLADGSGFELTADSRIPFLSESDLFRPKGSSTSIGHKAGDPETSVLFDNAHFFHDHQVEVSYVPRGPKWDAYRPAFAGDRLPRTLAKLKSKQPVTLVVSGDSISEGFNASKFTKTAPLQPGFPELTARQLERSYGSKVALHNLAVGGWSSGQGAADLDRVLKLNPDLVVIAYGMNDVNRRDPEGFKAVIKGMLVRIKQANPDAEVVLIATMTGNPDWFATPAEMFPAYRDALKTLEGPGVVLADLTAVWRRLLQRKRHFDLTGNGVNHPNDYGHRVYTQTLLGLLVESR
ncbi:MAG: SGNH/GDSL hydrolase family protein [Paludisphaera borealis]|uniref:SGNH/GDSL hydrolase family protein n=1 Tax=Paludisphaera borealis TaxID=1387353 RepID=UPI002848BAD0|nr:SGNH/GDSL hydrolase family protein [Paludisphaera borealis]MDR3622409.1 SGNH/GDSL hydrolase family protein [Paludisphaera borealis]